VLPDRGFIRASLQNSGADIMTDKRMAESTINSSLDAVQFRPRKGNWQDTYSYLRDLRIAITVANELCEQRCTSGKPSVPRAAETIAERGEFGLDPARICEIYDEVASTVGGFREFSNC